MMPQPLVLVFGGQGHLGRALLRRAGSAGVRCVVLSSRCADVRSMGHVCEAIRRVEPDIVVNAAAYTAVDRAESQRALAFAVNRDGAANVARAALEADVPCIHVSTDYVFGGERGRPYTEQDSPWPLGVYGASKLAGELTVRAVSDRAVILRTAWVYDRFEGGFVCNMLQRACERSCLQVVGDQFGSPTLVDDLADAMLDLGRRLAAGHRPPAQLYHLAGPTGLSRFEWMEILFALLARHGGPRVSLEAVPSSCFVTAARRPRNSMLNSRSIERDLGLRLPPLIDALERSVLTWLEQTSRAAVRSEVPRELMQ